MNPTTLHLVTPLLLFASFAALAQEPSKEPQLDVLRFEPNVQGRTFTGFRDAEQMDGGSFSAQLTASYGLHPRAFGKDQLGTADFVHNAGGLDVGVNYAPARWLEVGFNMPVVQIQESAGIGDLALSFGFAPLRQGDNSAYSLAIAPRLVLPTGSSDLSLSNGSVIGGGDVAFAKRYEVLRYALSLGYQVDARSPDAGNVSVEDGLRYGAGIGIPVAATGLELDVEWSGAAPGMQLLAGAQYAPAEGPIWVKVGAGPGLSHGHDTPDLRAFVQVGASPVDPGSRDADIDDVSDMLDLCRFGAEDFDGHMDHNGCPDVDNDDDGIPDFMDDCPNSAEDDDGCRGEDGCPDPDNDQDGVPDNVDACPDTPDDRDGFESADGCPDPDNDGDGIVDALDGHRDAFGRMMRFDRIYNGFGDCMNEPETMNGLDDEDGCSEVVLARVDLEGRVIVLLDKVYFDYDKATIQPASFPLLQAVQRALATYPEILQVEIQGHTDARGQESYNQELSQARVDAVLEWLVKHGVERKRLVAKGYGESMPLVPDASTEAAYAQNRRVQFIVVRVAGDPLPVEGAPEPLTP